MKNVKPKIGLLVAAALVGLSQTAGAKLTNPEVFVPLEKLAPQDRALFEDQVRLLEQSVRMDWDSVILGVNKDGELTLKDRKLFDLQKVAAPSTWTY